MARTAAFRSLVRLMRAALIAEHRHRSAADVLGATQEWALHRMSRRQFLLSAGATGAALALGTVTGFPLRLADTKPLSSSLSVGIVGAGLAGLACADRLKTRGIRASVYEATARSGGRCWSLRDFFPGQVAERGGELIDSSHQTVLGYAKRFGLLLEDDHDQSGEVFYHFLGQRYSESAMVTEFGDFLSIMRGDLNRLSKKVTAHVHTQADVALDQTNLLAYLEGHNGAGVPATPLIKAAIIAAYEAEYGLAAAEQSCLNLLLFIHSDPRSTLTPFSVFSDERFHLVDGNDRIVESLTQVLAEQITYQNRLVRVHRISDGRVGLTFQTGGRTIVKSHDAAVLAIPFTLLREVELDASLAIPLNQLTTIRKLGYGTNAKLMIGFSRRPWRTVGSNGTVYADLATIQTAWETNPSRGTETRGVLVNYFSGSRGAALNPKAVQVNTLRVLRDLNAIYPDTRDAATVIQGEYLAHLEHWPSNPLMKGSYTCYQPGQFTTMAGLEGIPADNLLFAGEHTNSFYEWQGFMEGAALSGIAAAQSIVSEAKAQ
ncbi:MAG TPA: NAD(P)/FAD-dependent oxidoreductase [Nitrospira sp.]|nr:NAD(P)/FAD-dependent oxidoreductase [Nitrospira sp.]